MNKWVSEVKEAIAELKECVKQWINCIAVKVLQLRNKFFAFRSWLKDKTRW